MDDLAITIADWRAKAVRLFGADPLQWRFVCPVCNHIASVQEWKDAGAPAECAGFSCVGRWMPGSRQAFDKGAGPCTYAGGGLFRLNPIKVILEDGKTVDVFAFDESGDAMCEPFVEANTTTDADRAAEARYWEHLRDIDRAADAQIAEIEAEAACLAAEDQEGEK